MQGHQETIEGGIKNERAHSTASQEPPLFPVSRQSGRILTSAEHYGAVINLDFDYRPYLDALQRYGFNLTRLFSGAYLEREESIKWMGIRNTLSPRSERFLAPWARSAEPGCYDGGCKFDLDRWDDRYFARLKDFLAEAGRRRIVAEFVFLSQMYNDYNWAASPLNIINNINGVGAIPFDRFTTLDDPVLAERQEALIRKVACELNCFDNLYYEICNEPNYVEGPGGTADWHDRLIRALSETENSLPNRHMIAVDYGQAKLFPLLHPEVSVHNVHYAYGDKWVGALELLEHFPGPRRALAFDETCDWIWGNTVTGNRLEAWEFILGGGAVYDHLNWSYTPGDPAGLQNSENRLFCRQLQILASLMADLDLPALQPNNTFIRGGLPSGVKARALAEEGRQYAVYLYHARRDAEGRYDLVPGSFHAELHVDLPAGNYCIVWIDPAAVTTLAEECVDHPGGPLIVASPVFAADLALKIMLA